MLSLFGYLFEFYYLLSKKMGKINLLESVVNSGSNLTCKIKISGNCTPIGLITQRQILPKCIQEGYFLISFIKSVYPMRPQELGIHVGKSSPPPLITNLLPLDSRLFNIFKSNNWY